MADERERGFSLVELMVVVLIIAVLIAIAIPTLLGARQRANDRAVQSNLRNAFTAESLPKRLQHLFLLEGDSQ